MELICLRPTLGQAAGFAWCYYSDGSFRKDFMKLYNKLWLSILWLGLIPLVSLTTGCGGAESVQSGAAPTTVNVTLDGQAVEGATVVFVPTAGGGRSATGRTNSQGRVEMGTTNPGDGVFPGKYQVTISKSEVDPNTVIEDGHAYFEEHGKSPPSPKSIHHIPQVYTVASTSDLSADVSLDQENHFEFELNSP